MPDEPAHIVYKRNLKAQRQRRVRDRLASNPDLLEKCRYCQTDTLCEWRVIRRAQSHTDDAGFDVLDEAGGTAGESGFWIAEICCEDCHIGPQSKINGHFCPKGQEATFLRRAGSSNLGG